MIAKSEIPITAEDFLAGMTSSPDTYDGGFSNETYNINLLGSVGAIRPSNKSTQVATTNGNVIATSGDARISAVGNDKVLVTDTGRFYTLKSGALTLRQTTGGGKNYISATTDIVQFRTDTFCTSDTNIARLIQTDLSQPNADWESWWTVTQGRTALNSGYRHPMVVFENALWIGDGPNLHKWDGTTSTYGFLTLSSEQSIVSLGVDSSSGKMLIGVNEGFNAASSIPAISKVLTYNGFSNKPDRAVIVDDMVTAFYQLGGIIFMCYGNKLGYWNGSGITFLRNLKNVLRNADYLVYKHKITSIANTLYVADGTYILAYGEVVPGKKIFYYPKRVTDANTAYLYAIGNCGSTVTTNEGLLGLFYNDGTNSKMMTFNVNYATAENSANNVDALTLRTRKYVFDRPVQARGLYIEYLDGVTNNSNPGSISLINDRLESNSYGSLANTEGSTQYFKYIKSTQNIKTRTIQLVLTLEHSLAIRRMVLEIDQTE